MINHEDMTLNFRDSSSDTYMRDAARRDMERFFLDGSWWKGSYGKQFKSKPKPEFNKLWRNINRVIGDINDMELNAVIVSNSDEATDEAAELLQKRWRNDFNMSDGTEASEIATMEAAVGGFGCTKLVCKYEDEENPDPEKQYLCTEIVQSAATSVYFDAGAIKKDKSDSRWGWQLIRTNRKKIEDEYGTNIVSFMNPASYEQGSVIDYNSQRDIYLAHYYEVVEKNLTVHDFSLLMPIEITSGDGIKDQFGEKLTQDDLKELKKNYEEITGQPVPTIRKKINYVEYALCDGEKYLTKPQRMPFKRIPLFPRYGYYVVLNGQEYYCGEVRKQTDNEMFHNFFGSSLMEIMSAPQVEKPEYLPEQIIRHANQRARADIDGVPYVLSDPVRDSDGNIKHMGPIGRQTPPQIGTGLASAGQFLAGNISQDGGMGQATVPSNASGEAIQNVNDRSDDAFLPIVKNVLHSIKAQCLAWIPAAQKIYFSNPRRLRVLESDGKYSQVTTLEMIPTNDGGYGPYGNNASMGRYSVQVERGESYKDSREAERQSMVEMLNYVGSDTEFGQTIAMNAMMLTDGEGTQRLREMAKYKMIELMLAQGYPVEPENEEEAAFIMQKQQQMQMQAQQASMNDPMMIAAQAEMQKAAAADREAMVKSEKNQIDLYKAQVQFQINSEKNDIEAAKANVDMNKVSVDTVGKQIENASKLQEAMRPRF